MNKKLSILSGNHIQVAIICSIFFLLLVASLFFKPIVFVNLVFCVVCMAAISQEDIFSFLLFAYPYSVIFKGSEVNGTSFFTIIEFAVVLLILYRNRKVDGRLLFLYSILFILMFLPSHSISLSINLKIIKNFMILAIFCKYYDKQYARQYSLYFIAGLVTSTVLSLFKERIPGLLAMYDDLNYAYIAGKSVMRFSGIWTDPNFFSIAVILSASICFFDVVYTNSYSGKNIRAWLVFGVLSLAGIATYSKSFILLLAIMLLLPIVHKPSVKKIFLIIIGIAVALVIIYTNPGNVFSNFLFRFSAEDLTSHRVEKWEMYLSAIKASTIHTLFGYGTGADYVGQIASHNAYLETIYYIGVVGIVAYISCIIAPIFLYKKKIKRQLENYFGYIAIALSFFFLDGFREYSLMYYLIIATIIYNNDYRKEAIIIEDGVK